MSAASGQPVSAGEQYTVEIEELGEEGDGVAYVDGFAVLVDGAHLGETVTVEVETVGDNFARASVVDDHFP